MRSLLLITPVLLLAATAWTQDGSLSSSKPVAKPVLNPDPVTCNEARTVLNQLQAAMERAASVKAAKPSKLANSDKAVTRVQILDEVDRLEREFRPVYALKPRTQYCNPAAVKFPEAERKKAIRLIKLGFLEPVAPLVFGPGDTLTAAQFSEALGFFVERWSDMTHLPSTKWSPDLKHHEAMPPLRARPGGPVPSSVSPPRASKSR